MDFYPIFYFKNLNLTIIYNILNTFFEFLVVFFFAKDVLSRNTNIPFPPIFYRLSSDSFLIKFLTSFNTF